MFLVSVSLWKIVDVVIHKHILNIQINKAFIITEWDLIKIIIMVQ